MKLLRALSATLCVLIGIFLFAFGSSWAPQALRLLPDTPVGSWIELIVPFLPMVFVGTGAAILVSVRR